MPTDGLRLAQTRNGILVGCWWMTNNPTEQRGQAPPRPLCPHQRRHPSAVRALSDHPATRFTRYQMLADISRAKLDAVRLARTACGWGTSTEGHGCRYAWQHDRAPEALQ